MSGNASLVERYLSYLETVRNLSPHTVAGYRNDLSQFLDFLGEHFGEGDRELDDVDHHAVRSFLGFLERRGCGRRTLARKLTALRTFFDWLLREGIVLGNPARALSSPRREKLLPRFISITDVRRSLDESGGDEITGLRNRAILEVLYSTGIRVSELTGMNVGDVDPISESIRIRGKRKRERLVSIGSVALEAVMQYITRCKAAFPGIERGGHRPVFLNQRGERLGVRQVQRIVGGCFERTLSRKGFSPHSLRHAFATHLLERGADIFSVKELLGHASLSSTQVYTHLTPGRLLEEHRKSHPRK